MSKLDLETVIDRYLAIVKANLNTKLLALDTEKNDFVIKKLDDNAYAIATLDSTVMNYNPFLIMGFALDDGEGLGPGTQMNLLMEFVIVLEVEGGDTTMWRRMMRYTRALQEIAEANFGTNQVYGKCLIQTLAPRRLEELGDTPFFGAGIRVKTSLT